MRNLIASVLAAVLIVSSLSSDVYVQSLANQF